MYAVTITTKDKCRNCISAFDDELLIYLQSKGVCLINFWYKLEESKFTKWHAHGIYERKWETSKSDKFYVFFKECDDIERWMGYCEKNNKTENAEVKYLDDGVFLQE